MNNYIQENIDWIESGKIGCVFASALVKQRDDIGWKFHRNIGEPLDLMMKGVFKNAFIASIIFPAHTIQQVKFWALNNGMYLESIDELYDGLRLKVRLADVAWVQYFGPDSHVKTRQAPHPMLSFTLRLPAHVYAKTMIKGIYHLAHASIEHLTAKKANTLWDQSMIKTAKELGHRPTIREAAKTTFEK